MRFVASTIACAGLCLVAAGCDLATDRAYFRQGVGSQLYLNDVATQTELQDLYVEHVCRQAGLQPVRLSDTMTCAGPEGPATWGLFVQAGMNDIDQRCDAYLTWLDNVRRSEAPILKQITDTGTAAALIMQTTGVGAGPIAIVAAGFGLASNTFTNITSRLVLEVNHSTVQAVVLTRQKEYREELLGNQSLRRLPVVIASKPAAIYALRSYLRLCMPITIETEINNTVTVFERGGVAALENKPPMISARSAGVPIRVTPPVIIPVSGAVGRFEPTVSLLQGKAFQRTLCVEPTGQLDTETRFELREFNAAFRYGGTTPPAQLLSTAPDNISTFRELQNLRQAQKAFPSCKDAGMRNAFEVGIFTRYSVPTIKSQVAVALARNQIAIPAGYTSGGTIVDPALRKAIADLRRKFDNGQAVLDPPFYDWISRSEDRN